MSLLLLDAMEDVEEAAATSASVDVYVHVRPKPPIVKPPKFFVTFRYRGTVAFNFSAGSQAFLVRSAAEAVAVEPTPLPAPTLSGPSALSYRFHAYAPLITPGIESPARQTRHFRVANLIRLLATPQLRTKTQYTAATDDVELEEVWLLLEDLL